MLRPYLHDLIIAGCTDEAITDVNAYLSGIFKLKELGVINRGFLG